MFEIIQILLIIVVAIIFIFLFWAGIVSFKENEFRASSRFFILSFLSPIPYLVILLFSFPYQFELELVLLAITIFFPLMFFLPISRNTVYQQTNPATRIDERDTMFSRNELRPGSKAFEEYYRNNTDKKAADDGFRSKAGLLKPGSSHYNTFHFASADASFETIEALRNKVNGPVNQDHVKVEPERITNYIRQWSRKLGTLDCGITRLKDYHLYSVGGRAERRNKPVVNSHKYALAFTVEMDKTMMDSAPSGSIVMESGQQYLESGKIALQVASFIRNLGYEARAHIDGNYEVVCPLVARDAGLGYSFWFNLDLILIYRSIDLIKQSLNGFKTGVS